MVARAGRHQPGQKEAYGLNYNCLLLLLLLLGLGLGLLGVCRWWVAFDSRGVGGRDVRFEGEEGNTRWCTHWTIVVSLESCRNWEE